MAKNQRIKVRIRKKNVKFYIPGENEIKEKEEVSFQDLFKETEVKLLNQWAENKIQVKNENDSTKKEQNENEKFDPNEIKEKKW